MFLLGGMGIILLNFAQGMRADASVDLSGPTPARGARLDQKVRTKQNSRVLFLVQVVAGVVCIVVGFFAASKILVQKVPKLSTLYVPSRVPESQPPASGLAQTQVLHVNTTECVNSHLYTFSVVGLRPSQLSVMSSALVSV